MPLYLGVHETLPANATFDDVAGAPAADLAIPAQYGVRYVRFWVDDAEDKVFCLAEAPDAAAAEGVHREAHGLVATPIHAVREGI